MCISSSSTLTSLPLRIGFCAVALGSCCNLGFRRTLGWAVKGLGLDCPSERLFLYPCMPTPRAATLLARVAALAVAAFTQRYSVISLYMYTLAPVRSVPHGPLYRTGNIGVLPSLRPCGLFDAIRGSVGLITAATPIRSFVSCTSRPTVPMVNLNPSVALQECDSLPEHDLLSLSQTKGVSYQPIVIPDVIPTGRIWIHRVTPCARTVHDRALCLSPGVSTNRAEVCLHSAHTALELYCIKVEARAQRPPWLESTDLLGSKARPHTATHGEKCVTVSLPSEICGRRAQMDSWSQ